MLKYCTAVSVDFGRIKFMDNNWLLDKHYNFDNIEKLYQQWEESGYFSSDPQPDKDNYSILLPPPNVTGTLHMGHAFQHTLMDTLIRYQRMLGKNTLWQVGTDHAGIATQIVVTRELEKQGIDAASLTRQEFLDHAWQWKEQSGNTITKQMRRMGTSCDWGRERFTMDEGLSKAVVDSFVALYEQGLIYRGKRLVNWDPVLLTAVSDLEVVSEEEEGMMYYVRYPYVDNPDEGITIGTTRPETILVDGAIAVHPDDKRFQPLLGKRVWVPLTDPPRSIEIIADEYVEPDFGSGCVKITAAHDFNDFEVANRHPDKNIPILVLLTPDAKMNENAPPKYQGMDRFEARNHIVDDLEKQQYLTKKQPHRYKLPRGDRTGVVVEPMLTDQWFLKAEPLAKKALALVADEKLNFVPQNWEKVYQHWLNNIHDWCISRQLRWGHQIPAWYDDDNNIYVAKDEAAAKQQAGGKTLRQDADVLDTWYSSSLWAFSTLGWPDHDNDHFRAYFPTSILVTGFDIIFFWVARMAMMTDHFMKDTPFKEVYITGLVRDADGNKMSKSRGNILDPLDIIDGISLEDLLAKRTNHLMNPKQAETIISDTKKHFPDGIRAYGVDALRFTFASLASYGRDIKFDLSRCDGYHHFCDKLWNATRFTLGVCDSQFTPNTERQSDLMVFDAWILSRLQRAKQTIEENFAIYRFDLAAHEMYQFFWNGFCDWYLELAKIQIRYGDEQVVANTKKTLLTVLETGLRLCHPVIPFITEELWQKVIGLTDAPKTDSIMLAAYPQVNNEEINENAEAAFECCKKLVEEARRLKREVPTGDVPLTLLLSGEGVEKMSPYIARLVGISKVEILPPKSMPDDLLNARVGNIQVALQYDSNSKALQERFKQDLEKIEKELAQLNQVLSNAQFLEKANLEIIDKKQQRQKTLLVDKDNVLLKIKG